MPDTERTYDAVIVGGGIAGLAAAWRLRDKDILVLEADDRVGGRIMSFPRGDYWLNLGAHLFPPPGSPTDRLVTELGLATETIPGDTMAIFMHGKLIRGGRPELFPFRLPLSPAGRLSLIRAGLKLRPAMKRYFREMKNTPDGPEGRRRRLAFMDEQSMAAYLGKLDPDVDGLFRVVAQRLTAPLEDLSTGSGATVLAHAWAGNSADQVRNLRGGSSRLPEAISRALGERVVTGATAATVTQDVAGGSVTFDVAGTRQQANARAIIVTTPAYVTASIVEGLPAETGDALNAIRYGPFVIAGILTGETGPMPWDGIYAVATVKRSFNILFNAVNIVRTGETGRTGGSFMCYGGGEAGQRLLPLTDDQIKERFLFDLYEIFPQAKGLVREVMVRKLAKAMPYVWPGRAKIQPALERPLGNVFLAGDYLDWAHMEASITTANEAADKARVAM